MSSTCEAVSFEAFGMSLLSLVDSASRRRCLAERTTTSDPVSRLPVHGAARAYRARRRSEPLRADPRADHGARSASCSPRAPSTSRRSRRSPSAPASRGPRSTSTSARGSTSSTRSATPSTSTPRSSRLRRGGRARRPRRGARRDDRATRPLLVVRGRVLSQLYGVVAIDPAARDLVDRQRDDRRGEMERLARHLRAAGRLRPGIERAPRARSC